MSDSAVAVVFVLLAWWAGTGAILVLDGLPRSTFRYSLGATTVLAAVGLYGLWWSSHVGSVTASYVGFAAALSVWAWHELTFLLGVLSGPRREPCPEDARGWRRFSFATQAVIHHEVALAFTLLAVVLLTFDGPNPVGAWTFSALWVMRLSAKLNLFLGVRQVTTEFIPARLKYLVTYFRTARLNPLMPFSVLLGCAAVAWLLLGASDTTDAFLVVGRTMVATLLAMAVLEHLFLALPIPDAILWRWALRLRGAESGD